MKVDFGYLISRSLNLMFKNKWVVILASFAFMSGSLYSSQSFQWYGLVNNNYQTAEFNNFWNTIKFESVVNFIYFSFLATIILSGTILLNFYITSYSTIALFYGISFADEEEDINLTEISIKSRKKVWELFFSNLVSTIFSTTVLAIFGALGITSLILMFTSNDTALSVISTISFFLFLTLFFAYYTIFYFSNFYLNYLVIFSEGKLFLKIIKSYKNSYKHIVENFVKSLVSILFYISFGIISLLFLIIAIAVVTSPFIIGGALTESQFLNNPTFNPFAIMAYFIISFSAAIQIFHLVNSLIGIFFYSFDYLFAKNILKNENR